MALYGQLHGLRVILVLGSICKKILLLLNEKNENAMYQFSVFIRILDSFKYAIATKHFPAQEYYNILLYISKFQYIQTPLMLNILIKTTFLPYLTRDTSSNIHRNYDFNRSNIFKFPLPSQFLLYLVQTMIYIAFLFESIYE